MSDAIYLIGEDSSLREMRSEPYDSESLLQRLLAEHPSVLADGDFRRNWLLLKREAGVPTREEDVPPDG